MCRLGSATPVPLPSSLLRWVMIEAGRVRRFVRVPTYTSIQKATEGIEENCDGEEEPRGSMWLVNSGFPRDEHAGFSLTLVTSEENCVHDRRSRRWLKVRRSWPVPTLPKTFLSMSMLVGHVNGKGPSSAAAYTNAPPGWDRTPGVSFAGTILSCPMMCATGIPPASR
jgi:hypothetical protein